MNVFETVSAWAVQHLSQKRAQQLRKAYISSRQRMQPVLTRLHGTFDSQELQQHLDEVIGRDFDVLFVHSSVNHMLPYYTGNPLELVRMLVDFCGPERTLAMPAFYFGEKADSGAYNTFKRNPVFDLRRTPSQMGLATELFRRFPGYG